MVRTQSLAFAASALLSVAGQASAQDAAWNYSGTFYLWGAETQTSINTPNGTIDAKLSFSDALENLDFAFMGAVAAQKGPWSIIGDFVQTNLSFSTPAPNGQPASVEASVKTQVLNAYALREVRTGGNWSFDAGAGVRWFNTDTTLAVQGGPNNGLSARSNDNWFDPVIAARLRFDMSDRWSGAAFVDYGGFRSGSESFQILLSATYAINDSWSVVGGYRYLDITHGASNDEFKFSQSGPLIGVGYEF